MYSRLRPALSFSDFIAAVIPSRGKINEFEELFAKKFNNNFGVMFSHGRSGLYALLKIWGLNKDEVICPAYTCVVVPHAIVLSGNIPVFVDCAEQSWNMDYDGIRNAISEKTRAIIVTHLFGYPMDLEKVEEIVKAAEEKYGQKIYIIQDAAHSYGAKHKGRLITESGDAAFFGLNVSKILTSVFGGMVITNSEETGEKLRSYRDNNFKKDPLKGLKRLLYLFASATAFVPPVYGLILWMERKGFLNAFVKYYEDDKIDFPADWDQLPCELEARVGLSQLKKYDDIIEKRVKSAEKWKEMMSDQVTFHKAPEGTTYSHCVGLVDDRQAWLDKYQSSGIQLGILIEYCCPDMKAYENYGAAGTCPVASSYTERTINFPIYPDFRSWKKL